MLQDLMALQDHPSENNEGWEVGKADSEKMDRYRRVDKKQKKRIVSDAFSRAESP